MSHPCNLCKYEGETLKWDSDRKIVRCPDCGLIYWEPVLQTRGTEGLYQNSYFQGGEYSDYVGDREALGSNFKRDLRLVKSKVHGGRIFEIGCAYGFFLDLAKSHYEVGGIDITAPGISYARDILGIKNVLQGQFLDQPDPNPDEKWDAVCLWDTIEHLERPAEVIEKAAEWLKPGGHLFLTTGDIGSLVARVRGKKWRMIHPPTHLYYFDEATMTRLIERAGLHVTSIRHPGVSRNAKSMVQTLFRIKGKSVPRWTDYVPNVNINLNLRDIMQVVAQKV